jgi:hypothetical protein
MKTLRQIGIIVLSLGVLGFVTVTTPGRNTVSAVDEFLHVALSD